jgi:crossover junction endodeoxyribonuclease RuvC
MRFLGIDPATTTGFVALDAEGNVLVEEDLRETGKTVPGGISEEQLANLGHSLYNHLQPDDVAVMENAAPGTQRGITTGMIHGVLRYMIHRRKIKPVFLMPNTVKKYVGVTGWIVESGKKRRLEGPEKKAHVAAAVLEHFGYSHKSDNVIDAYIMAKIAEAVYRVRNGQELNSYKPYQQEVIQAIISPSAKPSKKKKTKSQANTRPGKPAAAGSHTHLKERQFLF